MIGLTLVEPLEPRPFSFSKDPEVQAVFEEYTKEKPCVFLVSEGEYSDYRILGVYDQQNLQSARSLAFSVNGEVEVLTLNERVQEKDVWFCCTYGKSHNKEPHYWCANEYQILSILDDDSVWRAFRSPWNCVSGFGKTKEQAFKSATDRRYRLEAMAAGL